MSTLSDRIIYNEPLNQKLKSDLEFHSIIRNIQHILNTRSSIGINQYLDENAVLDNLTFGLPDFSFLSINSNPDKEKLTAIIEKALNYFEPRLHNVSVDLGEYAPLKREMTIKVSGYFNRDNIAVNCLLNLSTMEFLINEWKR